MTASSAFGGVVSIDFEEEEIYGSVVGDYYSDRYIKFSGVLFDEVDLPFEDFSEPMVRDLNGVWGNDWDTEAVSTGSGLASAAIGFEVFGATSFEGLTFDVARAVDQEITVIAREAGTSEIFTHTFTATYDAAPRTVEEFTVNLEALFAGAESRQWLEIAVHNHGGFFGIDNINYEYSVSVPGAGAFAAMVGLAGLRNRRR